MSTKTLPILDISALLNLVEDPSAPGSYIEINSSTTDQALFQKHQNGLNSITDELYDACTNVGFFYIKIPFPELERTISEMEKYSHIFFNKDISLKRRIDMSTVGSAWRGFFSVGEEYTSGVPDIKEGIYFGTELPDSDPRVISKLPMHGSNVFPRTGDVIQNINTDNGLVNINGKHQSFQFEQVNDDLILEKLVLEYMSYARKIGMAIIDGISLALKLPRYALRNLLFADATTVSDRTELSQLQNDIFYDPLCLFRIFNYPATKSYQDQFSTVGFITPDNVQIDEQIQNEDEKSTQNAKKSRTIYSVGEHCDYGLVTVLYQDNSGGLEVRDIKSSEFIQAPPIPKTLVINLGDSLEKMTNGLFVSTPHRVLNKRQGDRISFPFFLDPRFDNELKSLVGVAPKLTEVLGNNDGENSQNDVENDVENNAENKTVFLRNNNYKRWDGQEIGLQEFKGTYGNYILAKVSKVFPQLAQQVGVEQ
jgi:isopenicillin N synthase-like dioxygenase